MPDHSPEKTRLTMDERFLAKALKRAAAGEKAEIPDPQCPGLMLRLRGGRVTWSYRGKLRGKQRRWTLGDASTSAQRARHRCNAVKAALHSGTDPTPMVISWATGLSIEEQHRVKDRDSIPFSKARDLFLNDVFENRAVDTYTDYKKKLRNESELDHLDNAPVSLITAAEIETILAKVAKRSASAADGLQRTLSSMWTFLAKPSMRGKTGVEPHAIREARAPDRVRARLEDVSYKFKDAEPPDRMHIGRAVAIAKLGVFNRLQSAAILLVCGSFQRRRTVCGGRTNDFEPMGGEILWAIPPYFRKTAKKKRSQRRHLVPLVGFAADAARAMKSVSGADAWMLPALRQKQRGVTPKTPYLNTRSLSSLFELMPGIELSPHDLRYAAATYGPSDLGWHPNDSAMILDHLEGFDPGDVTAQFYNMDPAMLKKRKMMTEWIGWLEDQASKAIAADPMLTDRAAIAKLVAIKRAERRANAPKEEMLEAAERVWRH